VSSLDFNKKLRKARQFMEQGNYAEALGGYAKLVRQYPGSGVWGEYGSAAAMASDFDLADRIWERIRSQEPNTADLLSRLAREYQNIRLHAKARALHAAAASIEPGNLDAQINLAALLARTSSVGEARSVVNKCLELDPRNEQGRYLSAQLDRRDNKLDEAERQFRELIASGLQQPYINYSCHYELAQILDRTGRFDEAMAELAEAKRLARQTVNVEAELKMFDTWHGSVVHKAKSLPKNILETWNKSFPLRARTAGPALAFLGGPERSGTTLLEKILDAHPAVAACDECLGISRILSPVDAAAPVIPAQRLDVLRQRYLKILIKTLGQSVDDKVLLDKNPPQTVHLPAVLRAFPELRVLIALRDPRDVVLSLYFQNHTHSNYLTFELLAQHYRSVMDVWLAVREWEGLAWMETRYEDIVADLPGEGSRVTSFLGLDWHENQARYHERNREKTVMSNNYSAVTQPVYKRSVGRWRAYEKQLAPVLPMLEPYCRKFGYA